MPLFFFTIRKDCGIMSVITINPFRICKDLSSMSKKKKRITAALWVIAFLIAAVSFFAVVFTDYLVSISAGLDALLYTVTADTKGTNPEVIRAGARFILPPLLLQAGVTALLTGAVHAGFRLWKRAGKGEKARKRMCCVVSCVLLAAEILYIPYCSLKYVNRNLGVTEYLRHRREKTGIYEECFDMPDRSRVKAPQKGKNLIFVWLESMETTYADGGNGGFQEENLIPRLMDLSDRNLRFAGQTNPLSGLESIDYSRWTFGALFSALSGAPCAYHIRRNTAWNGGIAPEAVFLTDILNESGYRTEYICGSDASFAGTASALTQHGVQTIYDLNTAYENGEVPQGYFEGWGIEDGKLYEIVKKELTRLSSGDAPFMLMFSTIDTHYPTGYLCADCPDTYENPTANIVSCADRQASEFIAWCGEQPFFEDTVIVLLGDHPRMDAELVEGVPYGDRKLYNCFINVSAAPGAEKDRVYTMLDIAPTLLTAMGFTMDGGRFGFGTDLASGKPTLPEELGYEYFRAELSKTSDYFIEHFY